MWLIGNNTGNLGKIPKVVSESNQYNYADIKWPVGDSVSSSTKVVLKSLNAEWDLDRNSNPFSGMGANKLLTQP